MHGLPAEISGHLGLLQESLGKGLFLDTELVTLGPGLSRTLTLVPLGPVWLPRTLLSCLASSEFLVTGTVMVVVAPEMASDPGGPGGPRGPASPGSPGAP